MTALRHVVYILGMDGAGKSDLLDQLHYLSHEEVRCRPVKIAPTTGQDIREVALRIGPGEWKAVVECREIGGSMVNSWERFLKSQVPRDECQTRHALLFVVDATSLHQLPLASTMFHWLRSSSQGILKDWPALVVLQKCCASGAMTTEEAAFYFGNTVLMVEVDTWNGNGLRSVRDWLSNLCVGDSVS